MTTQLKKTVLFQKMICAILVSHSGHAIATVDGTTGVTPANRLYTKITNHISSNRRIYGTVLGVVATIIIGRKITPKINEFNATRRLREKMAQEMRANVVKSSEMSTIYKRLEGAGFGRFIKEFAEKYPGQPAADFMVKLKKAGCNKAIEMREIMDLFVAGKLTSQQQARIIEGYRNGIC